MMPRPSPSIDMPANTPETRPHTHPQASQHPYRLEKRGQDRGWQGAAWGRRNETGQPYPRRLSTHRSKLHAYPALPKRLNPPLFDGTTQRELPPRFRGHAALFGEEAGVCGCGVWPLLPGPGPSPRLPLAPSSPSSLISPHSPPPHTHNSYTTVNHGAQHQEREAGDEPGGRLPQGAAQEGDQEEQEGPEARAGAGRLCERPGPAQGGDGQDGEDADGRDAGPQAHGQTRPDAAPVPGHRQAARQEEGHAGPGRHRGRRGVGGHAGRGRIRVRPSLGSKAIRSSSGFERRLPSGSSGASGPSPTRHSPATTWASSRPPSPFAAPVRSRRQQSAASSAHVRPASSTSTHAASPPRGSSPSPASPWPPPWLATPSGRQGSCPTASPSRSTPGLRRTARRTFVAHAYATALVLAASPPSGSPSRLPSVCFAPLLFCPPTGPCANGGRPVGSLRGQLRGVPEDVLRRAPARRRRPARTRLFAPRHDGAKHATARCCPSPTPRPVLAAVVVGQLVRSSSSGAGVGACDGTFQTHASRQGPSRFHACLLARQTSCPSPFLRRRCRYNASTQCGRWCPQGCRGQARGWQ